MNSDTNNIKLFTNEKLVRFIDKIGHNEVSGIIKETNLDGRTLLELSESEISEWNLPEYQKQLLLNCISQIKSNPLIYLDDNQDHLRKMCKNDNYTKKELMASKTSSERMHRRLESQHGMLSDESYSQHPNVKKYFTFVPSKKQINENLVNPKEYDYVSTISLGRFQYLERNSYEHADLESFDWENESRYSSEYIYPPHIQKTSDDRTEKIRKYLKSTINKNYSNDDKEKLLKQCNNTYLELSNIMEKPDNENYLNDMTETNISEDPLNTISNTDKSRVNKEKEKEKSPVLHCVINLCCFSCYVGCKSRML